jgi:hypothetical protein
VNILSADRYAGDPTGRSIDLTVDRPFTGYPAKYIVTFDGLISNSGGTVFPGSLVNCFGLARYAQKNTADGVWVSKDIANPQTLAALQNSIGSSDENKLGTYQIGETGDYATDYGIDNLKKRIFRRITTRKGAFAYAPEYGISLGEYSKRLGSPGALSRLAIDAEEQIGQEPDVSKVKVTTIREPNAPNVVRFIVLVRTIQGNNLRYEAPVTIDG